MKDLIWLFSVRYWQPKPDRWPDLDRWAVVGPARASTVEAALHLAGMPEELRAEIRSHATVRDFVEGKLDRSKTGYYVQPPVREDKSSPWLVCIGPVHEVLS
ncbi:MAG TPA: hypothetical protein VLE97_08865 [Gaiellaceae bacterium]|nr:hypothetical protein [Gaiellaceae bacterium]